MQARGLRGSLYFDVLGWCSILGENVRERDLVEDVGSV